MLSHLRMVFGLKSRARRRDLLTRRFRPRVEALEERLTPNAYTPTIATDPPISGAGISVSSINGVITGGAGNGQVSLRSAVFAANAHGGSNTITFNQAVGTTYTLTIAPVLTNIGGTTDKTNHDATTGSLDVTGPLTITGNGSINTIVQAGTTSNNGIDQIFDINPLIGGSVALGFAVRIDGVTLQNGKNASNDQAGDGEGGAIAFDAGPDNAGSSRLPTTSSPTTRPPTATAAALRCSTAAPSASAAAHSPTTRPTPPATTASLVAPFTSASPSPRVR